MFEFFIFITGPVEKNLKKQTIEKEDGYVAPQEKGTCTSKWFSLHLKMFLKF